MIPESEILLRVVIAAALGALIGYDRERQGQPAGLRTHIILVIGATLAMTLSINLAMQFRTLVPNGDPARLAAQVISGIGFLGAGAILRYGVTIKGLTTASSLWTMAIVGLGVGAGYTLVAAGITLLILLVLNILTRVEKRFISASTMQMVRITAKDRDTLLNDLDLGIRELSQSFEAPRINKNLRTKRVKVEFTARMKPGITPEKVLDRFSEIVGVRDIRIG